MVYLLPVDTLDYNASLAGFIAQELTGEIINTVAQMAETGHRSSANFIKGSYIAWNVEQKNTNPYGVQSARL